VIGAVATTAAAVTTLGMLLAYSRRIVRETHGEVAPPVVAKKPSAAALELDDAPEHQDSNEQPKHDSAVSKKRSTAAYYSEDDEEQASAKASAMRKTKRETSRPKLAEDTAPESSRWVSGAEEFEENYDDEAPTMQKRTKAERKALRREKERRAA
jgi:hypothetical protein